MEPWGKALLAQSCPWLAQSCPGHSDSRGRCGTGITNKGWTDSGKPIGATNVMFAHVRAVSLGWWDGVLLSLRICRESLENVLQKGVLFIRNGQLHPWMFLQIS